MELSHKDVRSIISVIDEAQHLEEIELVFAGFRLHVRRGGSGASPAHAPQPAASGGPVARAALPALAATTSAPAQAQALAHSHPPRAEVLLAAGEIAIRAPMLGTFYRASAPGEKPFVEVGQKVKADDSVAVIEVMKLFNSIRAGVDGTVVRIDAENASLVEFNQVLIVIAKP